MVLVQESLLTWSWLQSLDSHGPSSGIFTHMLLVKESLLTNGPGSGVFTHIHRSGSEIFTHMVLVQDPFLTWSWFRNLYSHDPRSGTFPPVVPIQEPFLPFPGSGTILPWSWIRNLSHGSCFRHFSSHNTGSVTFTSKVL
jgi:hypothetical protein